MGLGKPVPAQIELMEKSDRDDPIDWVARLKVEQIVVFHGVFLPAFPRGSARLCVGRVDQAANFG